MARRFEQAQALDERAGAARSLAEAQALHAEADRLRRAPRASLSPPWSRQPLLRN
ncbi:MAG: hypothetical protein WDN44_06010 [Sphingomonas sp.]